MPTGERLNQPERTETTSKQKPLILCVDDELVALNALRRELKEKFGDGSYNFESANSPKEALKIIDQHTAEGRVLAMVIADQMMPGMTGAELLSLLDKDFPASVKILLTSQVSLDSAIHMFNFNQSYKPYIDHYVIKSWDKSDLLIALEEGLQQYQLSQQGQSQQQFPGNNLLDE